MYKTDDFVKISHRQTILDEYICNIYILRFVTPDAAILSISNSKKR